MSRHTPIEISHHIPTNKLPHSHYMSCHTPIEIPTNERPPPPNLLFTIQFCSFPSSTYCNFLCTKKCHCTVRECNRQQKDRLQYNSKQILFTSRRILQIISEQKRKRRSHVLSLIFFRTLIISFFRLSQLRQIWRENSCQVKKNIYKNVLNFEK